MNPVNDPGATAQRAGRREWIGVAALALPCLLVVMDLSVLFLAVPSLTRDLRPSSTELLWITDVYGFLIAGALIVMGALGDRIGRRKVLLYGSAAFGAASIVASLSTSPLMLIAARGIQGVAGATLIPSTMGLLFAMFPHQDDRLKAMGVISAGFTGGAALGPILGGVLLDFFDWHAVFLINVPAMLAVLVFVPRYVPEFANSNAARVDVRSAVLLLLAVLPMTYAIKRVARGSAGAIDAALITVGLAVGVLFLQRQRRVESPLMDLSLFRIRVFSVSLTAMATTTFAMFGAVLRLPVLPARPRAPSPPGGALGAAGDRDDDAGHDGARAEAVPALPPRAADGRRRRAHGGRAGAALAVDQRYAAAACRRGCRGLPARRRTIGHARQQPDHRLSAAAGQRAGIGHQPDVQRALRRARNRGARQRRDGGVPRRSARSREPRPLRRRRPRGQRHARQRQRRRRSHPPPSHADRTHGVHPRHVGRRRDHRRADAGRRHAARRCHARHRRPPSADRDGAAHGRTGGGVDHTTDSPDQTLRSHRPPERSAVSSSINRLANVIIPVADQDVAVEFYTQKLGLEKRLEVPFGPDFRWIEVGLPNAETTIALCPPGSDVTPGGKQTGISFLVDDADAFHATLTERGVDVDPEVGRFGEGVPPTFWLRDPEGNILQIIGA